MLRLLADLIMVINKIIHFHLLLKNCVKIQLVADQFKVSLKILWVIVQSNAIKPKNLNLYNIYIVYKCYFFISFY